MIRELGERLTVGPTASGDPGLASPLSGGAYSRDQVEEPAAFLADQPGPRYPELLLHERATGRVRARFVVGVAGRADGSPEIVFATRQEFASSVRAFLARARYRPALIGGKPVPQLVEQEFVFELTR
ncbi:MAG TPA: energy transducer TonB [Gemmatimonadaceae bacterium]|nr:energy transducer TonB [Gemmatimonadaceae bacterium]